MTRATNHQLAALIDSFLAVYPLDVMSCDAVKGRCDGVATDLYYFLAAHGVESRLFNAIGFRGVLPPSAHSEWHSYEPRFLGHVVVRVGNRVIDLTGAQYGEPYAGVRIEPWGVFRKRWMKVKPFGPWPRPGRIW